MILATGGFARSSGIARTRRRRSGHAAVQQGRQDSNLRPSVLETVLCQLSYAPVRFAGIRTARRHSVREDAPRSHGARSARSSCCSRSPRRNRRGGRAARAPWADRRRSRRGRSRSGWLRSRSVALRGAEERRASVSLRWRATTPRLWREYGERTSRHARPADPHLRAARQVRRGTAGERAPGARRRGRPRLLRAAGLIRAIERFDPARDVKFETYAITRVKRPDHRRAAGAGLGAPLDSRPRTRDRAGDRRSRAKLPGRRATRRSRAKLGGTL